MSRRRLRIGVDGEALRAPLAGVGRYVLQLLRHTLPLLPDAEWLLYSRLPASALALPEPGGTAAAADAAARCVVRAEALAAWRRLPSFAWLKTRGAAMARRDGLDLFWAPRTLHPRLALPTLATVHDLNHLLVPGTMAAPTRWSHRLWFAGDVAAADLVVANSAGTAERLAALLGVHAAAVIAPGVEPRFSPHPAADGDAAALAALGELGIRAPYLLSVATLEPRKNVALVLRAFVALKRGGMLQQMQLVLAGARGWRDGALRDELAAAREQGVLLPGFVDDALLPALYRHAAALVCPSRYEGFGMPVLEARACGTPLLINELPELREAGGAGALAVAPTHAAWCQALLGVPQLPRGAPGDLSASHGWHRRGLEFATLLRRAAAAAGAPLPQAARTAEQRR